MYASDASCRGRRQRNDRSKDTSSYMKELTKVVVKELQKQGSCGRGSK